jgi:ribosomal protein S15P/S13E
MPEFKSKTNRELDRSLLQSYKNANDNIAAINERYGYPTVSNKTRESDIGEMTKNVEEMKTIVKRNMKGHHSANDGSFLTSRAAKFGCMGKCGGKKK